MVKKIKRTEEITLCDYCEKEIQYGYELPYKGDGIDLCKEHNELWVIKPLVNKYSLDLEKLKKMGVIK